jgi:serine phosphatase RsbU (regulator of sigma subunit)
MQNFRELLSTINHHDLKQQKEILDSTITVFQGDHKQVDDMLVLGIKLG